MAVSRKKKRLPQKTPTAAWAYQAIAKLGGWADTKRTGKAGWSAVWEGWFRLEERVDGFFIAKGM